jgi:hypothetical protein
LPSAGGSREAEECTGVLKSLTTILRLRHKQAVYARRKRLLLVEQAGALTFRANTATLMACREGALALLEHAASGDLASIARDRLVA